MATCPSCQVSSRVEPNALVVEEVIEVKPLGTFSLAGVQMKASANRRLRLRCTHCLWSILGYIDGDHFVADPPGG